MGLRLAAKKALSRGLVLHNAETSSFRAVLGKRGREGGKGRSREEREALRREKKERRREEKRARKERKHQKRQKNVSSSTEESPAKVLHNAETSSFIAVLGKRGREGGKGRS